MKILNSMFLKWNAGTENAFLNYAKALEECGFEVINLVHPQSQIISKMEANNLQYIKTKFLGRLGKSDFLTIFYFKYLIKKHQINLVLAHQGRLIELFKKSCPKNVKLIGINHGHNPKYSVGTDLAITLNSNVYQTTIKLGQPSEKTALLPNGIDLKPEFFIEKTAHKKFTIGSYGRFSQEKGYDILIESCKILHQQDIDFYAKIGGSGVQENELKNLVKQYGLQEKIEFIGWVVDQKKFFAEIDLFILPSRREESPLTPLESMRYFTAVLATKNCGCLDLIKDGENGFLTDIDDAEKMAEKIKFIIHNQNLLSGITQNAYKHLEQNYSLAVFKDKLSKLIASSV